MPPPSPSLSLSKIFNPDSQRILAPLPLHLEKIHALICICRAPDLFSGDHTFKHPVF
jgi:hypothetical protein